MRSESSKLRPYTISSKDQIDTKSTRKRLMRKTVFETYVFSTSGSDLSKEESLESRREQATETLKQYISSNNLLGLSWSRILLRWVREGDPEFIFSDQEWLSMLQIRNELTAYIRLHQLILQTLKQKSHDI